MKNKRLVIGKLVLLLLICASQAAYAQYNGGNISSPYSMFGVGDLRTSGTAASRSMGGIGLAERDPILANIVNPASLSTAPRQTFLFAIGAEGVNNYLSTATSATSKNGASLGYIAVRFPLAKGVGFGFSMSPLSSVGYGIRVTDQKNDVATDIGNINYHYTGKGDISQYKIGVGGTLFKGFSLGANFIYYLGDLKHITEVVTNPYISNKEYATISRYKNVGYNKPGVEIGAQYQFRVNSRGSITLGALYQPYINSSVRVNYLSESSLDGTVDTLFNSYVNEPFGFPQKLGFGIQYMTEKLTIGIDYKNEQWGKSLQGEFFQEGGVNFRTRNEFILGIQYVPNRMDIRDYYKRMTYRLGFRYATSYMQMRGHNLNEMAISAGVGFPLNMSAFSSINVGLEYAFRGTKQDGLIRSNVVSFFLDVTLFSNTQWFVRQKFD